MKRIARFFLVLTVLLSVPWWWLSREYGGYGYVTLLMWTPAVAAVITLGTTGGSLSELGMAWREVDMAARVLADCSHGCGAPHPRGVSSFARPVSRPGWSQSPA